MTRADNFALFLILGEKNLSSLRMRLAVVCSWMTFIQLRKFLSFSSLLTAFILKECYCYYTKMQLFYFPFFLPFSPFFDFFPETGRTSRLHQEKGSHGLLCIHSLKCPMSKHLPPPPSCLHSWPSGTLVVLAQAASLPLWSTFLAYCLLFLDPWLPVTFLQGSDPVSTSLQVS